ncbi:MAG TPA: hypothetical protein VLH08_11550 [Acidobacteriota bacterium]|nr:hypothetical protein [Acidobacteriota bacterium]
MKVKVLSILALLIFCSIAIAEMTIFFKDGSSVNVTKIVFHENSADLFLLNGITRTVRSDTIDLKASGIPKAQGSYGQAGLSPNTREKRTATPPLIGTPAQRQAELKEEWEKAEQSAIATKTIGKIMQGDVVKIANRSAGNSATNYGDFENPEDGSELEGLIEPMEAEPYVVIYKSADGIFGKKLFDSATFHSSFTIQQKSYEPPPVVIPNKLPEQTAVPEIPPKKEPSVKIKPSVEIKPPVKEEQQIEPDQVENTPTNVSSPSLLVPIGIGAAVLATLGAAVIIYSLKRKKPFINTSRFTQYENELNDFELEIWLKHGRTMDQLLEICLKKFYQDQPPALAAAMKIYKGTDRATVIQSIARQDGQDLKSAEQHYSEMYYRINWIREAIRKVSEKIGKEPLTTTQLQPTQSMQAPTPVASSAVSPEPPPSPATPKLAVQVETLRSTKSPTIPSSLPVYLRNVLKQLGELTD